RVRGSQSLGQRGLALEAHPQRLPAEARDGEDLAADLEHRVLGIEGKRLLGARERQADPAQPGRRHKKLSPSRGSSTTPASAVTVPIRAAPGWCRASNSTAASASPAGTTQQNPQPMLNVSHMSSAATSARSAIALKTGRTGRGESIEKPTPALRRSRLSRPSPTVWSPNGSPRSGSARRASV